MKGLRCGSCSHGNKPYISAYDIALKHGYQGTEEDWVKTLQCIFNARVLSNSDGLWDCDVTYGDLVEIAKDKELHLITLDGKIAFMNGIDDNKVTFCTTNYETDDGTVYDKYELFKSGDGEFEVVNVSNETGIITLDRLAPGIQTSLAKAATAYQKPGTGIPFSALDSGVKHDIIRAPIIYISLIDQGGSIVVDFEHTDLHGYEDPVSALQDGADVRIQYWPDDVTNPYVTHPCIGTANNGTWLVFGGAEVFTDGDSYTQRIAWYAIDIDGNVDFTFKILS